MADRDGTGDELQPSWRLAAIVDSSPDAILGGTIDGVITFWNASAARIMGYSADEVIGRRVADLVPPVRAGELAHVMRQLRAGKRVEPYDTQRRRKDGTLVDLSVSVSPILDASGTVVGAATVAREITERKRAEADRRALENQVQQAERMETMGQLTSGIAHDFRNLLSVIVAYAERAEDLAGAGDPELRGTLGEIRVAADRAVTLTDDLLAFSGRAQARPEVIDLNALIAGLRDLLTVALDGRAELVFRPSRTERPAVLGDRGRLEQVLLNLAVNARDAMAAGGTLTISTRHVQFYGDQAGRNPAIRPGRYAELAVSDTGTGMSEEVLSRIFDRFFTTKPPVTGTGLGLSTVHGIITEAGGAIDVDSAVGRGTAFRIYLPALSGSAG